MESGDGELLVFDELTPCPYLPGQTARLPHRLPSVLSPRDFDLRLAEGDRRSGPFLYRTQCPNCNACEPIRLDVQKFELHRSHKRTWKRGSSLVRSVVQDPIVDQERIDLFNKHRQLRGLDHDDHEIDENGYANFLVISCCNTIEICYYHEEQLVAVAIADIGETSLSAVYTFYDPEFTAVGLGTFSILRQIELCKMTARKYLYLGYFIGDCQAMRYKGTYRPHERRIGGKWQEFA